jgi:hypothetical protein
MDVLVPVERVEEGGGQAAGPMLRLVRIGDPVIAAPLSGEQDQTGCGHIE